MYPILYFHIFSFILLNLSTKSYFRRESSAVFSRHLQFPRPSLLNWVEKSMESPLLQHIPTSVPSTQVNNLFLVFCTFGCESHFKEYHYGRTWFPFIVIEFSSSLVASSVQGLHLYTVTHCLDLLQSLLVSQLG